MTIAMTENGIFVSSQKNFYPPTDYRAHVPAASSHKKSASPYGFPMIRIKMDLFIVDWQLSDDGKSPTIDGEKLHALSHQEVLSSYFHG